MGAGRCISDKGSDTTTGKSSYLFMYKMSASYLTEDVCKSYCARSHCIGYGWGYSTYTKGACTLYLDDYDEGIKQYKDLKALKWSCIQNPGCKSPGSNCKVVGADGYECKEKGCYGTCYQKTPVPTPKPTPNPTP